MVALGICWEGQSKVYFVDPKAKINKEYFVEHILTPMVTVDIPRLYGKRAKDADGLRPRAYGDLHDHLARRSQSKTHKEAGLASQFT